MNTTTNEEEPMQNPMRYAIITDTDRSPLETVRRYLPWNYAAHATAHGILIRGTDEAGWTLDGYVIPRLASGLHYAREVTEEEAETALPSRLDN